MKVWCVMFHNSRMPRLCMHPCSIHETKAEAEKACKAATAELLMPPQMRKGARWSVEGWATSTCEPSSFLSTKERE